MIQYNGAGYRGVAQLVEYWSPKPWVVGSSPSAPAKKKRSPIGDLFFLAETEGVTKHARAACGVGRPICDFCEAKRRRSADEQIERER